LIKLVVVNFRPAITNGLRDYVYHAGNTHTSQMKITVFYCIHKCKLSNSEMLDLNKTQKRKANLQ